ncbi:MAG: hypothetical protein P8L18_04795 [Verrucomicrobiota bacterium]|nr:hypothetical protein [Verrucomicrobiota bacterium]MDG1890608.1 hypothetical protein [Verrucomicrobiota bacterium]
MQEKIKLFLAKRDELLQTRIRILEKIREIDRFLVSGDQKNSLKSGRQGRRPKNEMSLKEAIARALAEGSKDRRQILSAVQAMGYQFSTNNPLNSLSAVLYSHKGFSKDGPNFSLLEAGKRTKKRQNTRKKAN